MLSITRIGLPLAAAVVMFAVGATCACSSTTVTAAGLTDSNQSLGTLVAVGGANTCALSSGGGAWCWGENGNGQLGLSTMTDRNTPNLVTSLTDTELIVAGNMHGCALQAGGKAKCWGFNNYGQLGDGTTTTRSTPVAVTGLSDIRAISPGTIHTCAVSGTSAVACWGYNGSGQLGGGTTTNSLVPLPVAL